MSRPTGNKNKVVDGSPALFLGEVHLPLLNVEIADAVKKVLAKYEGMPVVLGTTHTVTLTNKDTNMYIKIIAGVEL